MPNCSRRNYPVSHDCCKSKAAEWILGQDSNTFHHSRRKKTQNLLDQILLLNVCLQLSHRPLSSEWEVAVYYQLWGGYKMGLERGSRAQSVWTLQRIRYFCPSCRDLHTQLSSHSRRKAEDRPDCRLHHENQNHGPLLWQRTAILLLKLSTYYSVIHF